jgi:hypothetical protein
MCDSICINFMVKSKKIGDGERPALPFMFSLTLDEQGELKKRKPPSYVVVSPLTGAKFKITAIASYHDDLPYVVGYRVEANIPACTVGNNAFVQNHVRSASKISLELLKSWLRRNHFSQGSAELFSLESSEIQSVTLTYLFDLKDEISAVRSIEGLLAAGDALLNYSMAPNVYKPVRFYGSGNTKTGYFHHREYVITSYVKRGRIPKSFSAFESKEIEEKVYGKSSRLLRCEIKLHGKWLCRHGLAKPASWHRGKRNPYEIAFSEMRKYFRFDDRLRRRRPRPADLEVLSEFERKIVDLHLSGADVRNHSDVPRLADRKYFSRVKRRIEDLLRIDISIPWGVQTKAALGELEWLFCYRKRYRPSSRFLEHTFTSETAKRAICQLKNMSPIVQ